MNPELKAKWVAALRSGEWKQTRRAWASEDGFCCLGVLIALQYGLEKALKDFDPRFSGCWTSPSDACQAMGLPSPQVTAFIEMNDKQGKSFAEIADAIEANL